MAKMKILFIVPRIDKASTRYRVLQYIPYLENRGMTTEVVASPRTIRRKIALWKRLPSFDLVFIQKKLFQPWEFRFLRKCSSCLVYDLDDAVMFKDPGARKEVRPVRERRFNTTARGADLVIAGNSYLKKNVLDCNGNVKILPTTIDIRRYRPKVLKQKHEIVIGWIGSHSTLHYLEALKDVFEEIGRRYAHVVLKIVADAFFDCRQIRVIKKRWQHDTEIEDLHSFDIGVMPLTDDVWSRGKCGFKLIQCMAVQVPVVCSPVGMNREIVSPGENGLFAEREKDWIEALTLLIENHALREQLGIAGRKTILQHYEIAANARKLVDWLQACCPVNKELPVFITGSGALPYKNDAGLLCRGSLPPSWELIPSSNNAMVAVNHKTNVYFKKFLQRNKFERGKSFFRGSRCHRACRQAHILKAADLPTPKVLYRGSFKGDAFIIFEGFAGVGFYQYLEKYFSPPVGREKILEKRELLRQAGSLIGKLHCRGIVHGDLRPDNLLVRKEGGQFLFCFIDNESNHRRRYIPVSKIFKNLVQFSMVPNKLLSRTDLMRLYRAYRIHYPRFSGKSESEIIKSIYMRSRTRIIESVQKNDLKKKCRFFYGEKSRGQYVCNSLLSKQISFDMDFDRWFQAGDLVLKKDQYITVKLLQCGEGAVVAKRFSPKNCLYHIKIWIKKERVFQLWEMTNIFKSLGVPVASPLGYIIERKGLLRTASYFFSQYLKGAQDLRRLSQDIQDFPMWIEKKKIISRFAQMLSRLHNDGFCHGDTKWSNIMADRNTGEFWMIDLDGAASVKSPLDHGVCKDISRFVVDIMECPLSEKEIETFMTTYCEKRSLNKRHLQKKVAPYIKKIINRHQKK